MIKVLRYGNKISPVNPVTGKTTPMQNVVFIEYGRISFEDNMANTSQFLNGLVGGVETGLGTQRIHTHPVAIEHLGLFPVNKEFPGHINRVLTSFPDIKQQGGQLARMLNGRPTYTKTSIDSRPVEDRDERLSNEDLARVNPLAFEQARLGSTDVQMDEYYGPSGANWQQGETADANANNALETSNLAGRQGGGAGATS